MYKIAVIIIAVAHAIIVLSMLVSVFAVPFLVHYFVAVPIMVSIIRILFSKQPCPVTQLENYFRKKAGMRQIGGFVGTYFLKLPKLCYSSFKNRRKSC